MNIVILFAFVVFCRFLCGFQRDYNATKLIFNIEKSEFLHLTSKIFFEVVSISDSCLYQIHVYIKSVIGGLQTQIQGLVYNFNCQMTCACLNHKLVS